ncbi:hypothetical protein SGPA1_50845 [Streptomyces misionensis JCM 4497]
MPPCVSLGSGQSQPAAFLPEPVHRSSGRISGQPLDPLGHLALVEDEEPSTDETGGRLPTETLSRLPGGTPDILELAHLRKIVRAKDQLTVVALILRLQRGPHQRLKPLHQLLVPAPGQLILRGHRTAPHLCPQPHVCHMCAASAKALPSDGRKGL